MARSSRRRRAADPEPGLQLCVGDEIPIDLIPAPAYIFDDTTLQFLLVNRAAITHYGYSEREFLGMSLLALRPTTDHDAFLTRLRRTIDWPTFCGGFRHVTKSGRTIAVEVVSQRIRYRSRDAHFVLVSDVSDRERAATALTESQLRLVALFENASDAILFANGDAQFVDANPAACRLLGFNRDVVLGLTVWDVTPPALVGEGQSAWRALLEAGTLSGEYRLKTASGEAEVEFRAVANVLPGLHLAILHDVTGVKQQRLEAELAQRESVEQMRRFSARARARREEEHTRFARELHDQLGQALAGLKIDLFWLQEYLTGTPAAGLAIEKVASMTGLVNDTITRVRRISSGLRPAILDRLGLHAAIEWQLEEFERHSGIRSQLLASVEHIAIDRGRATAIFRIVQEALTNVAAHAKATRLTVAITQDERWLRVDVSDNGRGLAPADVLGGDALGLRGMRERAELLDGTVEFRSRRPRGTTVAIAIPLAERRRAPRED